MSRTGAPYIDVPRLGVTVYTLGPEVNVPCGAWWVVSEDGSLTVMDGDAPPKPCAVFVRGAWQYVARHP